MDTGADAALVEHIGKLCAERDPAIWQRLTEPATLEDRRAQRRGEGAGPGEQVPRLFGHAAARAVGQLDDGRARAVRDRCGRGRLHALRNGRFRRRGRSR